LELVIHHVLYGTNKLGNTSEKGMNMMLKSYMKISITVFLLLLTGHGNAMSKNDTKFDWLATESAPKHYPMEIIRGTFIYHGEKEQGLYIPSGGTLFAGWGDPISNHVVGPDLKPLPDRLKITFFSYAEKQFYQGEFELPYEKMLALFREGVADSKEHPTYSRIMAGVAPGGSVAVWVKGVKTVEVFFGQAQKIELDPSKAFALPFENKKESDAYIAKQLVNVLTPEELESLKKDGIPFGLWSRYRNRYDWIPTFSAEHKPDYVNAIFVNGENDRRWFLIDKKEPNIPRAVPMKLSFTTLINAKKVIFFVNFDELETMAAFEKLGANGRKVYLEFEPRLPRTQIKVRLYNDKESIELKKIDSEDW
jgi:hypothetical protein